MKDACGRTIKVGDQIVYGVGSGAGKHASAAVVTKTGRYQIKAKVISHTEYGTAHGKEVKLGNGSYSYPLTCCIVTLSGGKPVDFTKPLIRRWDD